MGALQVIGLITILCVCVLSACSKPPYVWASQIPAERAQPNEQDKTIRPGDVVEVAVVGQELMSDEHTVGADGTIALPNVGSVLLGGRSTADAARELSKKFSTILENPQVSLVVVARHIEVSILGEIRTPGKYQLTSGDGVATALAVAGGVTEFGNENAIYLVRAGEPQRIRFRVKDLVRGGGSARSFALRDGDVLMVE